jgi:hypothetical protein
MCHLLPSTTVAQILAPLGRCDLLQDKALGGSSGQNDFRIARDIGLRVLRSDLCQDIAEVEARVCNERVALNVLLDGSLERPCLTLSIGTLEPN